MPKSISFSTFHAGNSCVEIVIVFQMFTNIYLNWFFSNKNSVQFWSKTHQYRQKICDINMKQLSEKQTGSQKNKILKSSFVQITNFLIHTKHFISFLVVVVVVVTVIYNKHSTVQKRLIFWKWPCSEYQIQLFKVKTHFVKYDLATKFLTELSVSDSKKNLSIKIFLHLN